ERTRSAGGNQGRRYTQAHSGGRVDLVSVRRRRPQRVRAQCQLLRAEAGGPGSIPGSDSVHRAVLVQDSPAARRMSVPEDKGGNGRTPFFSRLRARLLALVLLAILPALGLVLYTGFEQRAVARADAEASAMRVVKLAAASQKQHFEATRQLLATLAQLPQVRPDRAADCQALFTNLLQLHQIYANIGGLDVHGKVFASGAPLPSPEVDLSDRTYFQLARDTGKFAVGEYQMGRITGRPSFNMAHPLRVDGKFAGVVFAALDLKWLNQLAARADLPEGTTLTLIDRKGTILVRYQSPDPGKSWVGHRITNEVFLKF